MEGNPKLRSRKGTKWNPPTKSEPWPNRSVQWSEIMHLFPVTMGPCEAIKHTVAKMKKSGLMSVCNQPLTELEIKSIKQRHLIERRSNGN